MPFFSWFRTWRIIPDSKWSVTPIYKSFRPFGTEQPYLGDLLTMVINQLLTGMILQVNGWDIVFASMCYFEHRTRARHEFLFGGGSSGETQSGFNCKFQSTTFSGTRNGETNFFWYTGKFPSSTRPQTSYKINTSRYLKTLVIQVVH